MNTSHIDIREELVELIRNYGFSEVLTKLGILEEELFSYLNSNNFEYRVYERILNFILDLKSYKKYGSYEGVLFVVGSDREGEYYRVGRLGDTSLDFGRRYYRLLETSGSSYVYTPIEEIMEIVKVEIFRLKKNWTKYYI